MDLYSCRCKWDIFLKLNQIEEAFQVYLIGEVAHLVYYYISSDELPADIRELGKRLRQDIWNTEDAITLMKKVVNSLQWGEKYKEINNTSVLEEMYGLSFEFLSQRQKIHLLAVIANKFGDNSVSTTNQNFRKKCNVIAKNTKKIEDAIVLVKKIASSL